MTNFGKYFEASLTAWLESKEYLTFEVIQSLICYAFAKAKIWGYLLSFVEVVIKFDSKCFYLSRAATSSTSASDHRFTYVEQYH